MVSGYPDSVQKDGLITRGPLPGLLAALLLGLLLCPPIRAQVKDGVSARENATAATSQRFGVQADLGTTKSHWSVRVAVTLVSHKKTWWWRPLHGGQVDGVLVSWGIGPILDLERGRILQLSPSKNCPQDPFCAEWSRPDGNCLDLYMPRHESWRSEYACYAANRAFLFGEMREILKLRLPTGVNELVFRFYDRSDRCRRRLWRRRTAYGESGGGVPVVVRLRTRELQDLHLDVEIDLITSKEGGVKDLQIAACRIETADQARLAEYLLGGEEQFCSVEPAAGGGKTEAWEVSPRTSCLSG